MYQVFRHQSIVPYTFTQQHPGNCECREKGWLENQVLAVYKVLAEGGKWEKMKKILLDEQLLFVHFRLSCAERKVHLCSLLDCLLFKGALGSLMPFVAHAFALFCYERAQGHVQGKWSSF